VLGTLGYLSPEQARGEAVDARSDLFSLGCVLYECLGGKRAFAGDTPQELIAAVLRDEPPSPNPSAPTCRLGLARIVERCLAKDKSQRFQSASDLAFALRAAAPGSGAAVAAAAPAARGSLLPWLAAAALGLAGLAAGYALRRPLEAHEPVVTALTGGTSREASPAISPDGKFVAYLASDSRRTDLWVKFVGGGPGVNLTAASGLEVQSQASIGGPEISPDGGTIAVYAGAPDAPTSERGVWLIPAPLGGPPRMLVKRAGGLRWSADGKRIAYVRPDPASGDAILVARADGADERVLMPAAPGIHAHEPAWSADGAWIYFNRGPMNNNQAPTAIWRVPSEGGQPELVVATQGVANHRCRPPDGRALIYAGDQAGGGAQPLVAVAPRGARAPVDSRRPATTSSRACRATGSASCARRGPAAVRCGCSACARARRDSGCRSPPRVPRTRRPRSRGRASSPSSPRATARATSG
jgi:hypothetical protein